MIGSIVAAICLLGWGMQLWFGVAVLGMPGNHEVVMREESPRKFWMIVITELAVGLIIGSYRIQAGMR